MENIYNIIIVFTIYFNPNLSMNYNPCNISTIINITI